MTIGSSSSTQSIGERYPFIFTDDPKQRLRITRFLLAFSIYAMCIALLFYAVIVGFTKIGHALWLTLFMICSNAFFYALLRSGFNQRFSDPALTMPQVLSAQISIAGAYCIIGSAHGGILLLLAIVLVFGMFNLTPRDTTRASIFTVVIMVVAIGYKTMVEPEVYVLKLELLYLFLVIIIMPTISLLALQLTKIRENLRVKRDALESRNADLDAALIRIEHLATHDELTGLFNRRRMLEALADQQKQFARSGRPYSVSLVDLDFFKRINDAHGHNVGDETLRIFASEARTVLRETDVLSRWGGEEFLFLHIDTPPAEIRAALQRLRVALAKHEITPVAPLARVTFSAGIAAQTADQTIYTLVDRADKLLYRAKSQGRNCSVCETALSH